MAAARSADSQTLQYLQKALVDGLPEGLALAERLPIFCERFNVSWDAFQSETGTCRGESGPSRDALEAWRAGKIPNKTMLARLEASCKNVLVNRKGFKAPTATDAAKWLAEGSPPRRGGGHLKRPGDSLGITEPSDDVCCAT